MANPANSTAYMLNGRLTVNVTEAKTLAATDCGYVQNVIYANGQILAPATATQGFWIVRNGGVPKTSGPVGSGDNGNLIEVDFNASDTAQGLNVSGTASDGKKLSNTALTAQIGDELSFINTGNTDGPIIVSVKGIWAREA